MLETLVLLRLPSYCCSVIDSHCHLTHPKFEGEIEAVLRRARDVGVTGFVTIGDSIEESELSIALAEQHSDIYCAVGVHPHHANLWSEGDNDRLKFMVRSSERVCAIGEIGLDYHYDFAPRDTQRKVLEIQLRIAKELNVPAVVHTRESIEDLERIISVVELPKLVIHCCTERFTAMESFLRRGYFLSFSGVASFPNAKEVRETIRQCPMSQMMIETDSPYLAPVPFRGRRNEPANIIEIARVISEQKGLPVELVEQITSMNAKAFFNFS